MKWNEEKVEKKIFVIGFWAGLEGVVGRIYLGF
jgi:hypothetical protein